ncbi:MAG: ABC transporter permease, partial [Microbacteriaceae bacterium]
VATLSVGVLVTLIAAYGPARRAGHTPPVEAMRGEFATPRLSIKRRLVPAVVLSSIGVGLTTEAVAQDSLQLLGGGFVVVLISLLMLSPFVAPIIMSIFRPLTRWRPMGRLAQGNANRNPKRTAATAFALALGLALISCFALIGASLRATFTDVLENGQNWNYIISNVQNGPVAPNVVAAVQDTAGVASTVRLGFTPVSTQDDPQGRMFTLGLGGTVSDAFTLDMVAGDGELTPDTFLVTDTEAAKRGWAMGDSVTFTAPGAPAAPLTVGGIMAAGQFLDPMVMPLEVSQSLAPPDSREPAQIMVATTADADDAALRDAFEEATKNYPLVTYQDLDEYTEGANAQINTLLYIMYGMLALAIVISILGIVNTLGLSVVERRREVGMLRAVGTLRKQVRRMITIESILIATYGAIIGIALGLVYGWLFVGQLEDDGFTARVVPWDQFAAFVVIAIIVGALAALWPAIKASRTKPLEALAED